MLLIINRWTLLARHLSIVLVLLNLLLLLILTIVNIDHLHFTLFQFYILFSKLVCTLKFIHVLCLQIMVNIFFILIPFKGWSVGSRVLGLEVVWWSLSKSNMLIQILLSQLGFHWGCSSWSAAPYGGLCFQVLFQLRLNISELLHLEGLSWSFVQILNLLFIFLLLHLDDLFVLNSVILGLYPIQLLQTSIANCWDNVKRNNINKGKTSTCSHWWDWGNLRWQNDHDGPFES